MVEGKRRVEKWWREAREVLGGGEGVREKIKGG